MLERSSTFCKARKDYLSCATKGREAQLSSVVKVIPANARPDRSHEDGHITSTAGPHPAPWRRVLSCLIRGVPKGLNSNGRI